MAEQDKCELHMEVLNDRRLPHRMQETKAILASMEAGINTIVCGSVGTEKGTLVRDAAKRFDSTKHHIVTVDCSICRTEYAVLREVMEGINDLYVQKLFLQFRSNSDLIKRLKVERERKYESLKRVVLDNVDELREMRAVDDLLNIGVCVFLVFTSVDPWAGLIRGRKKSRGSWTRSPANSRSRPKSWTHCCGRCLY